MNQQGGHPSDLQIERYVAESFGNDPAGQSGEMEAHFTECDSCRERRLEAERMQLRIWECPAAKIPHPECPDKKALEEYAAGLYSPEAASQVRTHAAQCDFCAPLLKEYLEDFSSDLTDETKDFLDRLPASKPKWRRRFVRKHIVPSPPFFTRLKQILVRVADWLFRSKVIFASGLASIVLAATVLVSIETVPWAVNKYKLHQAQELTAAAFKEERPNELRLPWAPYTKFDPKRSKAPGQSFMLHRPSLVRAADAANKKLNSSDPQWIRIRGRVALLALDNEAVDLLLKAKDDGLDDPETEIDLAAAYFQRDTNIGLNPPDLGNTINLLNQVLKNPGITGEERATALFDLAIAYEKMLIWDLAVSTWKEYLKNDPDSTGPWHEEAQKHLAHALKQLPPPKQSGWRNPSFFLLHVSEPEVQNSIEEYQDIVLRKWLPESLANANSTELEAAHTLANLLVKQHADPWLKDFLAALHPNHKAALHALGAAIDSNRRGLPTAATDQAQLAIFDQPVNYPGNLRARFESVYANQRLLEEQRCLENAKELGKDLRNTHYSWLQVQIALEQATCLHREGEGKSDESESQLELARQVAEESHFPALTMRALAFDAGIKDSGLKESSKCWEQMAAPLGKGLELYWAVPASPQRLYEFYSLVRNCFRHRQLWYAAEAMQRRMIAILENEFDREDENVVLEATAHRTLAQILKEQQEESAAEIEDRRAISLLSKIPDEAVSRKYELPIKIELADLQLEREEAEAASLTLNEIANLVESTQDDLIRLNFYRVRGDAQRARGQLTEAERDYETGVEIAERALRHLSNERKRQQWTSETGEIYRGLVGVLLQEKNEREALQLWEWYQARSFAQRADAPQQASGSSWAEIEQTILGAPLPDSSSTRLVYATTKDRVYLWMTGRSGIKAVVLPENRADLEHKIQQYSQKCSNPISDITALEQESQDLFLLLLQPVVADLGSAETVVIDLDQAMNGLALESLKSPEGWYFGQKYMVVQSPGFIKENDLRPADHSDYESGLIVDSGDLPRSEHDDIVAFFPNISTYDGSDKIRAKLPALLADRDLFVFIGHGRSGALMLSNSAPLTQQDFPQESLKHLRLAVLAACSTGVAEYGPLDANNLIYAFLAGGTSSIVASQWDVDSEATTDLMKVFFAQLKKGDSVARSLFKARQEVFRNHSHPYYWGGFSITGRAS